MIWDPTPEEEVAQNVRSLALTAQGSQPLARALGVPYGLDAPVRVTEARIAAALTTQIRTYEPRATVAQITVAGDLDGHLVPTVRLR